jgi:hypothetical protein
VAELVARLGRKLRRRPSIPLADARSFAPQARRTLAVRAVLALGAIGLAVAAATQVPGARASHEALASSSDSIVVLDVSSSISGDTYARISNTLERLIASRRRYGLVFFSDVAYQALPAGSPASELRGVLRYFLPQPRPGGKLRLVAPSPWSDTFSSGTNISSGLLLADAIVRRDHLRRTGVLLVSDLADEPSDVVAETQAAVQLQNDRIPLRVVALNPAPDDRDYWAQLLGNPRLLTNAPARRTAVRAAPATRRADVSAPFPWALVGASLGLLALLALTEAWGPPLALEPLEVGTEGAAA